MAISPERFKPYAPDVHAVVRLDEALPPEHPVHVFVDLIRAVDLGHFVVPPGPKGEKPYLWEGKTRHHQMARVGFCPPTGGIGGGMPTGLGAGRRESPGSV